LKAHSGSVPVAAHTGSPGPSRRGRRSSSDVARDSHAAAVPEARMHPGACQRVLGGRQAPVSLGFLPAEQAQAIGQGPRSQGRRPGATSQYHHHAASDVASEPRSPPAQRSPGRPSRRMGVGVEAPVRQQAGQPGATPARVPSPAAHTANLRFGAGDRPCGACGAVLRSRPRRCPAPFAAGGRVAPMAPRFRCGGSPIAHRCCLRVREAEAGSVGYSRVALRRWRRVRCMCAT
jgi:hypothetical protein